MPQFDELAASYDELLRDPLRDRFASGRDFFIEQKCRVVSSRLQSWARARGVTKPLRVLDAGCGQGTAFQFFSRDVRVIGCDVSAEMLKSAAALGRVAVQEPYQLPFADHTFDAAFAFCVYHHIPSESRATHLRELRRVVRPGGEVMVFEHNPHNPLTAMVFRRASVDRGCQMIAPRELETLFRQAGFTTMERGFLLFVPEKVHRLVPRLESALAWCPLGGQYFVSGLSGSS